MSKRENPADNTVVVFDDCSIDPTFTGTMSAYVALVQDMDEESVPLMRPEKLYSIADMLKLIDKHGLMGELKEYLPADFDYQT